MLDSEKTLRQTVTEAHQHHAVQFYDDEKSLYTTVAGFLGQGLVDGQPAILIATAAHRQPILDYLRARMVDVDQAQQGGDLIVLDAHETLARFMLDDGPSPVAFESSMGSQPIKSIESNTCDNARL